MYKSTKKMFTFLHIWYNMCVGGFYMNFKVENIGQYLKEKRKEKSLTLNEVALMLELTAGYISRIERGTSKPSKEVLIKLCNIYDIPIREVIDDNGDVNLDNIKVGTDLLKIINSNEITYNGVPIEAQDRINLALIVETLLSIDNLEDKNNFIDIISNVKNIIVRKQ